MPDQEPQIDLTKIDFPSDGLTFKRLRLLHPEFFDSPEAILGFFDHIDATELQPLVNTERDLARHAFNAAVGRQEEPPPFGGWEEDRKVLAGIYMQYGLASGPVHAEQLIRTFEEAAAEQGRRHGRAQASR